jgi:curved DNA-binding protein CbpA
MGASPAEIRIAYQRIAFAIDPAGSRPDLQRLSDIQNAYGVLRDPRLRLAHDIELSMGRRPLSAEAPRWRRVVNIPGDFLTTKPSWDELRDHLAQNFLGYRRKSEGPFRWLGFEAMLRREDARFGCNLPVSVANGVSQILLRIPSGTRDGALFEMGLDGVGIRNLALQARVVLGENLD